MPLLSNSLLIRPRKNITSCQSRTAVTLPSLGGLQVGLKPTTINAPESLSRWPTTQVTRLPNGVTVATEDLPRDTTSFSVYVDVGSVNEEKRNNGISNVLKHAFFRGTQKRNSAQLVTDISSVGGQFSASVSRESTIFQANVLNEDSAKAVEVLADVVQNNSFSEQSLSFAKEAALRDLEEAESHRYETVLDHFHSIAFQGTPLAQSVLGNPHNIKAFKTSDLVDFHRQNYTPARVIISAVGGAKHADVVKAASSFFNLFRSSHEEYHPPAVRFTGSELQAPDESQAASYCAFGFQAPSLSNPEYYVFLVLKELLGRWSTVSGTDLKSHLSEVLATEKLANAFTTFYNPYHRTGVFGVYTEGNGLLLSDLPFEVVNEMVRITQQVTDSEVDHAKRKALTSLTLELDSSPALSENIATQLASGGKRVSPLEAFQQIAAVSANDVRRVASKYIYDQEPVVVATGAKIADLPDYNQIRNYTYWRSV